MVGQILCSQEKGGPEESAYGRGLASVVAVERAGLARLAAGRAKPFASLTASSGGIRAVKLALEAMIDP